MKLLLLIFRIIGGVQSLWVSLYSIVFRYCDNSFFLLIILEDLGLYSLHSLQLISILSKISNNFCVLFFSAVSNFIISGFRLILLPRLLTLIGLLVLLLFFISFNIALNFLGILLSSLLSSSFSSSSLLLFLTLIWSKKNQIDLLQCHSVLVILCLRENI